MLKFTKLDKFKLIGLSIKAASGILGGSMILSEARPYLTLSILALGAVANEVVSYIKEKEISKSVIEDSKDE